MKNFDFKKGIKNLIFGFAALLVAIMLFVFVVDPLYQFRSPLFDMPVILENQIYQTPGAAKNLDYDALIMGSSMTENFSVNQFNRLMNTDMLKLSYAGAYTDDYKLISEQAFSGKNNIRYMIIDLNDFQLFMEPGIHYVERPEYLYSKSLPGKYKYLLNYDCFNMAVNRVLDGLTGTKSNIDTAYHWDNNVEYGTDALLPHYPTYFDDYDEWLSNGKINLEITDEIKTNILGNAECMGNIISSHPETEFIVFYPPYSTLYWLGIVSKGQLDQRIYAYETVAKELLKYENVKFVSFLADENIICDLNNFRDECHYSPEISSFMCDAMVGNEYVLTEDNVSEYFDDLREFVLSYDYSIIKK